MLRARTKARPRSQAAGGTVGEVLTALADKHPDTREQLFAADGELNRYVNVYLNDEDVRVLDGLETSVADTDTVVILPAMAGGRSAAAARSARRRAPRRAWAHRRARSVEVSAPRDRVGMRQQVRVQSCRPGHAGGERRE